MQPLYKIKDLTIDLPTWGDRKTAVTDINFELYLDEILCIVGESGSGKSVLARALMGLFPSKHVCASKGEILLDGEDVLSMSADKLRTIRGNKVAMIFQEPMTSLNPVFTCGQQVMEVLQLHKK